MQRTLRHPIELVGVGLHSGKPSTVRLCPAPAGQGVVFVRVDVTDGRDARVVARFDKVDNTRLNTRIANEDGVTVSTVEHLMAAFAGCGVHNATVEIDGPEVPVLDGSSHEFSQKILNAGTSVQTAPLNVLRVLKPVMVDTGEASAMLVPDDGFFIDMTIDFSDPVIGRQSKILDMANGAFLREVSDCRTFCRNVDVQSMRRQGLALGGSYHNAVVVEGDRVLSPGGMRRADECVRHKMLDILGDLSLAGFPLLGRFIGVKSGHAQTNMVLRKLMADPDAYRIETATPAIAEKLPGMDVRSADLAAVG